MRTTLKSKIASAMWILAAVSTFASALLTGALLVSSHRESVRQQLQATAASLVSLGVTHFSELKDFSKLNNFIEDALQMDRVDKIIRVYDASRNLIFTTMGADYDKLPEKLEQAVKKPVFLTIKGKQRSYDSLVMPYEGEGSKKTFYLQVAIPLPKYPEVLEFLWWQSLLLVGVLIAISVILSKWLSGRLLMPVGAIAGHLKKMDPAKIEDWKPIRLGPESGYLGAITDGINVLADRTRASISQLKKMSRYVAHEMRTPLTILQGEAETALIKGDASKDDYERVLRSSLEEIGRMSEIVNTVLRVGEDARLAPFHQPMSFDLIKWTVEHKKQWEKSLERPIIIEPGAGPAEMWVRADPKLLFRLIDNLVRNVKNHTPKNTVCSINLFMDESKAVMAVSDEGGGLPQNIIDSLNEDGSASDAAGVGLNLCYRIAEISGLELRFSNRPANGLKVEIRF